MWSQKSLEFNRCGLLIFQEQITQLPGVIALPGKCLVGFSLSLAQTGQFGFQHGKFLAQLALPDESLVGLKSDFGIY